MARDFLQDLKLAARLWAKSPGFVVAAVLCLALGVGANTAVFSFADFFLFQSLPVSRPDELVRMNIHWASGLKYASFSYPDFADLRRDSEVFDGLAASGNVTLHLSAEGRNERLWGELVSADFFSVLGVPLALGREFTRAEESEAGAHPVLILTHALWQGRFAADPGIVGKGVTVNGRPMTVVGVSAPGFHGSGVGIQSSVFLPLGMVQTARPGSNALDERGSHWIGSVIGRLKPGVDLEAARAAVKVQYDRLIAAYPDTNTGKSVSLLPEAQAALHPMVRSGFAGFIGLMGAVVGLVLLLACSNVASLLVAKAASRRREIAVRLALGAGRGRLVRQLLAESLLLTLVAGAAGLGLAVVLTRFLAGTPPPVDLPLRLELSPSPRVLAFTLGVALLSSFLVGLAPALSSTRPELVPALKGGGGRSGSQRLRRGLVVAQVAISLMLLIGSGLALKSFANAHHLDLGFKPDHQLIAGVELGLQGYDEARGRVMFDEILRRARELPGVTAAGWATTLLLAFNSRQTYAVPQGHVTPEGSNDPMIDYNIVGPGYFEAAGLPLLAGRGFETTDGAEAPGVVIVNRTFAETYWPGEDPLTKTIRMGDTEFRVVGLAGNGKYFSLGEAPKPYLYRSMERIYQGSRVLHLRTAGDEAALVPVVRELVGQLDPDLPLRDLKPMRQQLAFAMLPVRLAAIVVSAFALLALLLASIGLYAVIAFWVGERAPEIGIRMALGAAGAEVRALVLRQGLGLTGWGLGAGLVGGTLLALGASKVLYQVRVVEAGVFIGAALVLATVAFGATLIPALRATALSPVRALRSE